MSEAIIKAGRPEVSRIQPGLWLVALDHGTWVESLYFGTWDDAMEHALWMVWTL